MVTRPPARVGWPFPPGVLPSGHSAAPASARPSSVAASTPTTSPPALLTPLPGRAPRGFLTSECSNPLCTRRCWNPEPQGELGEGGAALRRPRSPPTQRRGTASVHPSSPSALLPMRCRSSGLGCPPGPDVRSEGTQEMAFQGPRTVEGVAATVRRRLFPRAQHGTPRPTVGTGAASAEGAVLWGAGGPLGSVAMRNQPFSGRITTWRGWAGQRHPELPGPASTPQGLLPAPATEGSPRQEVRKLAAGCP